jgi:hypothetical protein
MEPSKRLYRPNEHSNVSFFIELFDRSHFVTLNLLFFEKVSIFL